MLKLFLVDSEQNRTVVPLLRTEITIGRAEGNTIRLTDQNISRLHARLLKTATGYALEDLSRYGIVGPHGVIRGSTPVQSGESYRLGDYLLEFKEERTSMPLPAARPKSPLPQPKVSSTADSWDIVSPSATTASTSTSTPLSDVKDVLSKPAETGTAVFLADDVDAALAGFGASSTTEPASISPAPAGAASELGGGTAGSIAVEPEPVVEPKSSSAAAAIVPPAAPSATAPSAPAFEAPASAAAAPADLPRATMTLRPTSVQAMKLVGQTAPFSGAELHLTMPRIVIGSSSSCDVMLEHAGVAPEHLALRYDGGSWWVDALAGQVRLDGDLVPTSKLWKGAVLTFGGLDFRFSEPSERLSLRLAPLAASAPANASSEGVDEFDEAVLKRGKRNQTIGIAVGAALAAGLVGLLALGGDETSVPPFAEGSAVAAAASAVAPVAQPPASGSGSGASTGSGEAAAADSGSGAAVVAVVNEADAKAAEAAAKAKADADAKAAAEAADAARAAAAAKAAADRQAAAAAAKAAREAKAADAAAARAASRSSSRPPAREVAAPRATPAPAPARTAVPAKATPPQPFQEVTTPAAAEPAGPTATSLIADAKRAAVQNNRRDAVKFLEQARRLDPKNAEVNQLLFSNYRALGNTLRAGEAVKRYLALRPNDPKRSDYENWLEQNATP